MMEAFDQAYGEWQHYWQQLAALKKKHKPNTAPLELWTPLEDKCKAAFKRMWQIKKEVTS